MVLYTGSVIHTAEMASRPIQGGVEQKKSWKAHVESLMGSNLMDKVAIHGLDGTQWGATAGFNITWEEFDGVLKALVDEKGTGHASLFYQTGFTLSGRKYKFIRHGTIRAIIIIFSSLPPRRLPFTFRSPHNYRPPHHHTSYFTSLPLLSLISGFLCPIYGKLWCSI